MIRPNHLCYDMFDVNPSLLRNKNIIQLFIDNLVRQCELKAINDPIIHQFEDPNDVENDGITAVQILGESSIVLHTYPKEGAIYIDIFSCGFLNAELALQVTLRYFKPIKYFIQSVQRTSYTPRKFIISK